MYAWSSEARTADGIDGIPALLTAWQAEVVQLGRGRPRAQGVWVALSCAHLTYLRIARRSILRVVVARDELALFVVPACEPAAMAESRAIDDDCCLAAGPAARVEVLLPEHSSLLLLHRHLGGASSRPGAEHAGGGTYGFRALGAEYSRVLAECARHLGGLCQTRFSDAELARVLAGLEETAGAEICALLGEISSQPSSLSSATIRRIAVTRACDYITAHAGQPVSLQQLCAAAGVGMRTLEYGFGEAYGIGPMAYLRSFRLNRVRRDLATARDAQESVTAAAKRWCFTHMGQFSKDYRLQFGERPSATLRRNRQANRWSCAGPARPEGRPA